jgi:hypothetical protein
MIRNVLYMTVQHLSWHTSPAGEYLGEVASSAHVVVNAGFNADWWPARIESLRYPLYIRDNFDTSVWKVVAPLPGFPL